MKLRLKPFVIAGACGAFLFCAAAANAETLPQPEEPTYQGYYEKPAFSPVASPLGEGSGRRFSIASGAGSAGATSGVWLTGSLPVGSYRVTLQARASAPGPTIRVGLSDSYLSAPLPLTTDWKEYSETIYAYSPTDRAGEWFREGNLPDGWIEVAGFTVTPVPASTAETPEVPSDPANESFIAYYQKPLFVPTESPKAGMIARRLSLVSGGGPAGDMSGVWLPGQLAPGTYEVSIRARASGAGTVLRIGLSDKYSSEPLSLTPAWQDFKQVFKVTEPTDRAGQWYRQGNLPEGWMDVAGFAVKKLESAGPPKEAGVAAPAKPAVAPCETSAFYLLFAPNSVDLAASDEAKLRRLADRSKASACHVRIDGFSSLSDRRADRTARARANAVATFFLKAGMPAAAVAVVARGGTAQFGQKDADNRRVVISIRP